MNPSDVEQERALEALFRSGRADPSAADLARLERRLSPWLDAAPPRKSDGGRGMALKSILFLVGCVLLSPSEVVRVDNLSTSPQAAASVAPGAPQEIRDTPTPAPNTESSVSVSSLPDAPAVVAARGALPSPARSSAAPAAEPRERASVEAAPAERAESEAMFLRRAQGTLVTDPARALQMLQEHPTRFPRAVLVQEREVMAIDALARLGRIDEARARAKTFVAQYPRSAHESRIASILKEGAQ
ncbi:MAG: hypothetical protein K0S65_3283 [Labilithrix sp.]|nr:hypothetical protein [Labilithrix sp.]